jgi:hypothetical protein
MCGMCEFRQLFQFIRVIRTLREKLEGKTLENRLAQLYQPISGYLAMKIFKD